MSDNKKYEYKPAVGRTIIACYLYHDENGTLVYEKVRFEPKAFRLQHRFDGKAILGIKGVPRYPYRLHLWKDSPQVIVCEGEKDADALAELGFVSTSSPFGAGNWPPDITPCFKGKQVFILYDVGEEEGSLTVAASLWGTAREIKICTLPSEKYEYDVSDLLNEHKERPQKISVIEGLLRAASAYAPPNLERSQQSLPRLTAKPELDIDHPFLNLWMDTISRVTDAPRIFLLFSGLGALSGLLNKHWISYPRRTSLNLYFLLLAPSTICRKSVVLDIVDDYLREVDPEVILPESFTPEALLEYLSRKCCGLIIWRELIQVGGFAFGSDYNKALPSLLTDLYDAKARFRRITRGEAAFEVNFPSISILAAGIQSWLISMMTGRENEFYGGLWTRFLLVSAPDEPQKPFRLPSRMTLNPRILQELRALHDLDPREIMLDPALRYIEAWGKEHQREALRIDRPEMQASFMRFEVALIKIAALLQLATDPNSESVQPEAVVQAADIIEYLKADLPRFFEEHVHFTDYDKAMASVLRFIAKHPNSLKGDITRGTHLKGNLCTEILKQLVDEGSIQQIPVPTTKEGGRPGKAYVCTERQA
jgi:hypothetical protein